MDTVTVVATIAVLTYNGDHYLDDVLTRCDSQITSFPYETLVIDSGSTDRTLSIVAEHPSVQLHQIPNEGFGHGKTRNLAASMARGEFVAFLVQDAVPADDYWLANLLAPFAISERVGCVFGLQRPRPDCRIAVKHDVRSFFTAFGDSTAVRFDAQPPDDAPPGEAARSLFFSDVNSGLRLEAWRAVPFANVAYAEDRVIARDLLRAGWLKAYTPFAAVEHSHDFPLRLYYRRMSEEFAGLSDVGIPIERSITRSFAGVARTAARNVRAAVTDTEYGPLRRLREAMTAPAFAVARYAALHAAARGRGSLRHAKPPRTSPASVEYPLDDKHRRA